MQSIYIFQKNFFPVCWKRTQVQVLFKYPCFPFSGVLLKNSPQQVLTGNVHVKNLTMAKLYVNEVNGIKFDDIYLKDKPTIITGLKHFEHLHCNEIKAETFNNVIINICTSNGNI